MPQILVMGATGRIGRALRQIWGHRADVLWQGRSQSRPQADWLIWEPGQPLPKLRTLVVLAGVTTGTAQDLAQNSGLAVDLVAFCWRHRWQFTAQPRLGGVMKTQHVCRWANMAYQNLQWNAQHLPQRHRGRALQP